MTKDDVTFIIPVFNLTPSREKNLWYTVSKILQTDCNVIIVEQKQQASPNNNITQKLLKYPHPENRVSYYDLYIDDSRIHKSKLINFGVEKCNTKFGWVNDIDCYLKFKDFISDIDTDHKFIQPFTVVKDLSKDETEDLLRDKKIAINFGDAEVRHIQMYGAQSFIFDIEAFHSIGGMDEEYTGWGLEDYDFFYRVYKTGADIKVLDNIYGCHLWHPIRAPNNDNYLLFKHHGLTINKIDKLVVDMYYHRNPSESTEYIKRSVKIQNYSIKDNNQKYDTPVLHLRPRKKPKKIAHVVNLVLPDSIGDIHVSKRVKLCLQSIQETNKHNVKLIGCTANDIELDGWDIHTLSRDASTHFKQGKDFAFLKDMLDVASEAVDDDDYIFYTNLDVMITPDIYDIIYKTNEDIIEFLRRDIDECDTLEEAFASTYEQKETGVDGIAIKKHVYMEFRDRIPDFVIGEPHWDTTISGLFKKFHYVKQNTENMYHIAHERAWDTANLSVAGQHNQKLFDDAKEFGLIDEYLISIQKDILTIIIDYNETHGEDIYTFCRYYIDKDTILVELLEEDSTSNYNPGMLGSTNYFPIYHLNDNTKCLNQKIPLINIAVNMFSEYDEFNVLTSEDILEGNGKSMLLNLEEYIEQGYLDNYVDNEKSKINIRDRAYINDRGLLELC